MGVGGAESNRRGGTGMNADAGHGDLAAKRCLPARLDQDNPASSYPVKPDKHAALQATLRAADEVEPSSPNSQNRMCDDSGPKT